MVDIFVFLRKHVAEVIVTWDVLYSTETDRLLLASRVFPHLDMTETFTSHVSCPFDASFIIIVYHEGRWKEVIEV